MKQTFAILLVLLSGSLMGQGLDNAGNGYLNGNYFFRWVNFHAADDPGTFTRATALYGMIRFDGKGNYKITGQATDSKASPGQATSITASGTYVVASSGLAEISHPLFPDITLWALVGTEAIVGDCTFPGQFDLFVAIPAPTGGVNNKTLQGAYYAGTLDFPQSQAQYARSALLALQADGNGNFAPFSPRGTAANLKTPPSQTLTGVTYNLNADGSGTANFPLPAGATATQTLISGQKLLYVSADGAVVLGGSATGFDMIVGIQALTGEAAKSYQGLYFYADLAYDLSSGYPDLYTQSGGRNIQGAAWYDYNDVNENWAGDLYYTDVTNTGAVESFGFGGIATTEAYYRVIGANGQMYFTVGNSDMYYMSVGVHARPVSGQGVFLSPYGVVDAANLAPAPNPIVPGEFISLFGSGFVAAGVTSASVPFPTSLAGVQVLINGRPAPISFISPNQINAIVPYQTTELYASVQVIASGKVSNIVTLYTRDANASVYTIPPGGIGTAAVLHADYSLVTEQNGAKPGETVLMFLTGLGATVPAVADGAAAPSNPLSLVPEATGIGVAVDGYDAEITFAGLAPSFAGLYQINFVVPQKVSRGERVDVNVWNSEAWQNQDPESGNMVPFWAGFSTFGKVYTAK